MAGWLLAAAIYGFAGVAAGAFGAHGLAGRLTAERLATFETAVRYHLIHAVVLLAVAWLASRPDAGWPEALAGWAFVAGIALFSGSLYVLVLSDAPWLGLATPIGGLALLAGWAALIWRAVAMLRA